MSRLLSRWSWVIATTIFLLGVTHADAQAPSPLAPAQVDFYAVATQPGVISLLFYGAIGTPVVFYERISDRLEEVGTKVLVGNEPAVLRDVRTWRCDRLIRHFAATTVMPDGRRVARAYDVRTPSCATRLELGLPRRLETGAVGRIRVVDRWGNGGVTPQLCITPPDGSRTCREHRLRRAVTVSTRRFRATTPGRWRVELRFRGHRLRRSIAVGTDGGGLSPPPTVLVTGDSTVLGVDSYLADELGDAATVRSDSHPGTGLAKPGGPWATLARTQIERLRPAATVVSLGVVDRFPLTTLAASKQECCGPAWIAEYSRRVRAMMLTYRRRGRGRVVWLTLPTPRGARESTDAVNLAVVHAAQGLDHVTVVRLDLVFTPNGFRELMPYRGRDVRVRVADGIHLTIAGSAIAARLVVAALRKR